MPTNVFLVRYKNGWHEVVDAASLAAHPRHEAFLALGALQSIAEVDRVAGMQLSVVAHPRTAVGADHDPMSVADRPYRSYNVGDIITVPDYGTGTSGQRVRAITGSEDENGEVTYSPELGDLLLEEQERLMLAVKKMSDGTLEGESPVAQPTRVYVPAIMAKPVPKVKGTGSFKIVSTRPTIAADYTQTWGQDQSPFNATLVTLQATPSTNGAGDGLPAVIELWQIQGGDGDSQLAVLSMSHDFVAGTTYSSTFNNTMVFGEPYYGAQFRSYGDFTGPVYVEAIFAEPGSTHSVEWIGGS